MAKKAFEIQGTTFSIGGVKLNSSADGNVVIPGITRATWYTIDEVDDTGDQEQTWDSPPVIIDKVDYNILTGANPETFNHATIYTAELDDGYIDEIGVEYSTPLPTEYNLEAVNYATANDMYAYIGVEADPFATFVPSDWVQIPFRPKFQAGEVESDLGGGGADTGDITFYANKIIGSGEDSGDGNGYNTIRLVPDAGLEGNAQYIIIDPTAPSHIHIRQGGDQDDSPADLYLGGEKNYVRVNTNDGVRIQQQNTAFNESYFTETTDFTSATWTEEEGSYYVQFTTTNQLMVTDFWNVSGQSNNFVAVFDGTNYYTLNPSGWQGNMGNDVYKIQVVQQPPVNPTSLSNNITFGIASITNNYLYLENNDFRVEVGDDIRMISNDLFRFINRSVDSAIELTTDDNNNSYTWYFGANGYLELPQVTSITTQAAIRSGGDIVINANDLAQWKFRQDGGLDLPGAMYTNGGITWQNGSGVIINNNDVDEYFIIATNTNIGTQHNWKFGYNGALTFPNNTSQTTAWTGGRVVAVPGASTGAAGDLAGDMAFNGTHMYYCIANFPTTYEATLFGGYSGNAYPSLQKGEYPQPQVGWTFVWNTVTYTIVDVTDPNVGEWQLQVDQSIDTLGGGTVTLTPPGGDIWKRVAWSNDTW